MDMEIAELAQSWDQSDEKTSSGELFNVIHERLCFLQKIQYDQYVPTFGPQYLDYESRLKEWLNNVSDESFKRILFELAPRISFFSRDDFSQLYRAAINGPITRWLIDLLALNFDQISFNDTIENELSKHTWFCPITDSMQISDFHHVNHLGGIDYRPDWRSLAKFGDVQKVRSFMENPSGEIDPKKICPLKRIVLLEDFIGSGTQILYGDNNIIEFIEALNIPVLILPLIVCPEGSKAFRKRLLSNQTIHYEPVLEINELELINSKSKSFPGEFIERIVKLVDKTYSAVEGNKEASPRPYEKFGFRDTGSLIVMHSNTPANTLPIIQHNSNTWNALFPRSARIK